VLVKTGRPPIVTSLLLFCISRWHSRISNRKLTEVIIFSHHIISPYFQSHAISQTDESTTIILSNKNDTTGETTNNHATNTGANKLLQTSNTTRGSPLYTSLFPCENGQGDVAGPKKQNYTALLLLQLRCTSLYRNGFRLLSLGGGAV